MVISLPNIFVRQVYKLAIRSWGMTFKESFQKDGQHAGELAGQKAEQEVSELLTQLLLDGCLILNDVPFPYGNLDHIVVRPDKTVFLLETKSHQGKVTWNGKHLLVNSHPLTRNPLCQVNRGIRWVRRMAKRLFGVNPWVVAVLVFPNADVSIRRSVKRVNVLNADNLLTFIRSYPIKSQNKCCIKKASA